MSKQERWALKEFARSANGDIWLLERDGNNSYVIHQANLPAGGAVTKMEVGAFLQREPDHPETHALIRLIGNIAAGDPTAPDADDPRTKPIEAAAPRPKPKPVPPPEPLTEPGKRPMEDPPDSAPIVPPAPDPTPAKEPPTQPGTAPIEDPPIGPDTVG